MRKFIFEIYCPRCESTMDSGVIETDIFDNALEEAFNIASSKFDYHCYICGSDSLSVNLQTWWRDMGEAPEEFK